MLTLKSINRLIAGRGLAAELVQGHGYLYFVGDAVQWAHSSSVAACRLNHLSAEQWLAELVRIVADSAQRAPAASPVSE